MHELRSGGFQGDTRCPGVARWLWPQPAAGGEMEYELNRLELELEDMATSMIFAQMTIQQVDSDLLQREDTLQEVHRMRAATRRELHLIEQLKATAEG